MKNSKMVKLFLNEVCKDSPLTGKEERRLCAAMSHGSKSARDALLLSNMRMVATVCWAYSGYGVPILDLYIEGFLGLHEAALRFNPDMNFKFTSYAVWWIRQKIVIALASGRPGYSVPLRFFTDQRALRTAREKGVPVDMSKEEIERVEKLSEGVVSTEAGVGGVVGDFIKTRAPGPDAVAEEHNTREIVAAVVGTLPDRERKIIKLSFGLDGARGHNLREVAEVVGLTKERVRQIKKKVLKKLQSVRSLKEVCPEN